MWSCTFGEKPVVEEEVIRSFTWVKAEIPRCKNTQTSKSPALQSQSTQVSGSEYNESARILQVLIMPSGPFHNIIFLIELTCNDY